MRIVNLANPFWSVAAPVNILNITEIGSGYIGGNTIIGFKGIWISQDGTKLVIQEIGSGFEIFHYNFGTAYDITTLSYVKRGASISTGDGVCMNPDGTIIFTYKSGNKTLNQATLSTAYDITTKGAVTSYNFADGVGSQYLMINPTGTKLYKNGLTGIIQWTLSTPYDVTTAGSETKYSATETVRYDSFDYYDNGNYVLLYDALANEINVVPLSTPYDITTMGAILETHSIAVGLSVLNIVVRGNYLYVEESTNKNIIQYTLN